MNRYNRGIVKLLWILVLLSSGCSINRQQSAQSNAQVWALQSLEEIGGYKPLVLGNPKLQQVDQSAKAIAFDGLGDGLLLDVNPIAGWDAFTIELVFKPDDAFPANVEQRFLHIQEPGNPDRRILIELRLNNRQQWYADFFMRTEHASLTLIDSSKTHPVNQWATIKMTYGNGEMKGYVNGVEEVSGRIAYLPISAAAKTSIGTRMDKRSWFKGAIKSIAFTHGAE
jgi:hypothetical protein